MHIPFWCTQRDFVEPRRKNSPLDYFYLRFGWPLSSSKLGNLLLTHIIIVSKSKISTIIYFRIPRFKQKRNMLCIFLFWCTQRDFVEPRRKNSPPDYFYLRFGWPLTSSKLGNLLFESLVLNRKGICSAYSFFGAPRGIRTPDLPVRSRTLYPTKPWVLTPYLL